MYGMFAGSDGHIYNKNGKQLNEHLSTACFLCIYCKGRNKYVHHLIPLAYFGEHPDGYDVDHIDYNKEDNCPDMSYQM